LDVCCRMAHGNLSGAPATSADRWGSTVGVLSCGPSGRSGGAPDRSYRLSGAPSRACLTSARFWRALNASTGDRWRCSSRCFRWQTGQSGVHRTLSGVHRTLSGDSPDSPVNYSGAPLEIPEGEEFSLECPGAPDTVRWHTGQSGAPDQGAFRVVFALLFEPFSWCFYWLIVNLWHL
jgi:hypothetical protein